MLDKNIKAHQEINFVQSISLLCFKMTCMQSAAMIHLSDYINLIEL